MGYNFEFRILIDSKHNFIKNYLLFKQLAIYLLLIPKNTYYFVFLCLSTYKKEQK